MLSDHLILEVKPVWLQTYFTPGSKGSRAYGRSTPPRQPEGLMICNQAVYQASSLVQNGVLISQTRLPWRN